MSLIIPPASTVQLNLNLTSLNATECFLLIQSHHCNRVTLCLPNLMITWITRGALELSCGRGPGVLTVSRLPGDDADAARPWNGLGTGSACLCPSEAPKVPKFIFTTALTFCCSQFAYFCQPLSSLLLGAGIQVNQGSKKHAWSDGGAPAFGNLVSLGEVALLTSPFPVGFPEESYFCGCHFRSHSLPHVKISYTSSYRPLLSRNTF